MARAWALSIRRTDADTPYVDISRWKRKPLQSTLRVSGMHQTPSFEVGPRGGFLSRSSGLFARQGSLCEHLSVNLDVLGDAAGAYYIALGMGTCPSSSMHIMGKMIPMLFGALCP